MPTKKVTYSKDKAVVVRVYVEKPRKKWSSSIQHHHLHYHIHHTLRQEVVRDPASTGYDRRAGLLKYSHLLRESARRGASSTPLLSKFANNNLQPAPTKGLPKFITFQSAPSQKKQNYAGRPACFDFWKLLIPNFLRTCSNAPKYDKEKKRVHGGFSGNGIRVLQVRRGRGRNFIPSLFSTARKRA